MSRAYDSDRREGDLYIPDSARILNRALGHGNYEVAKEYLDHHCAIDLIDRERSLMIALRIRKLEFRKKHRGQFTTRCSRPNGWETEDTKILRGYVDYGLYGFGSGPPRYRILSWVVIDFESFRIHRTKHAEQVWKERCLNLDGTEFFAFKIDGFPEYPPIVVDKS